MIGIDPAWDHLYDPQQAPVYGFCRCCGGEIYTPGREICFDCEEEQYGNSED